MSVVRLLIYGAVLSVLVVGLVVAARSVIQQDSDGLVSQASPRELWGSPETFEGKTVRTSGVLRVFSQGTPDEHYVVEEQGQYRVGVRGLPDEALKRLVGQEVVVEGVLRFAEDFGVFVHSSQVSAK